MSLTNRWRGEGASFYAKALTLEIRRNPRAADDAIEALAQLVADHAYQLGAAALLDGELVVESVARRAMDLYEARRAAGEDT